MRSVRVSISALVAGVTVLAGAGPAAAQLSADRLGFLPTGVEQGPGVVRLQGMGGFEIAIPDENLELNLYDFSGNPAGYGDDRDAWSMELRYSHKELIERDSDITSGTDVWINDGSLLLGYHAPGRLGVGGRIDYAELNTEDPRAANTYKLAGAELLGNLYLGRRISFGLKFSYAGEEDKIFSNAIYNINHEGTIGRAGAGLSVKVADGVFVGGRGEGISTAIDGESRGPYHTDSFTWDRPGSLWSIHGSVNRGRLSAAIDHTEESREGAESVDVSWSERFVFNPTDDRLATTERTFSEERDQSSTRARVHLDVTGSLGLAGAYVRSDQTLQIVANPNFIGSRPPRDLEADVEAYLLGASYEMLRGRLLLGMEVAIQDQALETSEADSVLRDTQDGWGLRLGGEALLSDVLIGRAGLRHSQSDLYLESFQVYGAPYGHNNQATSVAFGLGVLPAGGIWQLDVSYDVVVKSDIDTDQSRFGAYIKHLF